MHLFLKTSLLFFCIFITLHSAAQERHFFARTLAIDVIPIINLATGGQSAYNGATLIFTEKIDQKLFRFKFSINDRDAYRRDFIQAILLDSSVVLGSIYQINKYQSSANVHLSVGISKVVPNNSLFIYYGMDVNLGLNRGAVNTYKTQKGLVEDDEMLLKSKKEAVLFVGVTPVLGTKIPIGKRIYFGIEFGLNINYLLTDISYLDEDMKYQSAKFLSRWDINPAKFINNISFGVKF